jgi:hypothetical protein
VIAALIGLRLGRRAETSPPIARLLVERQGEHDTLPEHHPSAILLNRLWPLLLFTLLAGGLAFLAPQIPGIAAGFAIIWALAWRRQDAAVAAIEERDGASFYVRAPPRCGRWRSCARPASRRCARSASNGAVT